MIASESATQTGHEHDHVFLGQNHERNERRTWFVIALTSVMMVVEIAAGTIYGSMALVADGWHMSTHAAAMLIAALAYLYARRNAKNPRFTFGTGKVGDLAAFASAIVLALVALLIGWESVVRLANPVPISFPQAIVVAVIGLIVNLVSAWLLREDHDHHHGHSHHHDHSHDEDDHHHHGHHGRDQNLRAAYLHVLAHGYSWRACHRALVMGPDARYRRDDAGLPGGGRSHCCENPLRRRGSWRQNHRFACLAAGSGSSCRHYCR